MRNGREVSSLNKRTAIITAIVVVVALVVGNGAVADGASAADGSTREGLGRHTVMVREGAPLPPGASHVGDTPVELEKLGWTRVEITDSAMATMRSTRPADISENHDVVALVTPNDPDYPAQWGHTVARTDQAWDTTTGSSDQIIAVVDSGVTPTSELSARVLPGYNVLDGTTNTIDDQGHGTKVATVAAAKGNNAALGAGICWSCRVLPVKVLDHDGVGSSDDVATGIVWAVDHGASIITLSLGGPSGSWVLRSAVDYAIARGVVVVAAAGNDGATDAYFPAAYPEVISVGAAAATRSAYSWSNRGPWVDVQAPGCNPTQGMTGTMANFCGTSSATPYVAGVIALRRTHTGTTVEQPWVLERLLAETADAPRPTESAAHGFIDANAFVTAEIDDPDDPVVGPGTGFHPLVPARVLDTRIALGTPSPTRLGPGQTLWVQLAGRGGIPTSGVSAVSLNLTATNSSAASYLAVDPAGAPRSATSVLNPERGVDTSNAVIASVGPSGMIGIYNNSGETHLVIDVNGWFDVIPGGSVDSVLYNPLSPVRILDTRTGPGPLGQPTGSFRLRAGRMMSIQVSGRGGIPVGAAAATLNLTVTDPSAAGHVTVWPMGTPRPTVSSANVTPGATVANSITMPLSADGRLNIYSPNTDVDVILDTAGYFTTTGDGFTPVAATRLVDSRLPSGISGRFPPGVAIGIPFAPTDSVPANATAVVSKVTVTGTTGAGHGTAWPAGRPAPVASILNWKAGQTTTNLVYEALSTGGEVLLSASNGYPYVIVDVFGYFTPVT